MVGSSVEVRDEPRADLVRRSVLAVDAKVDPDTRSEPCALGSTAETMVQRRALRYACCVPVGESSDAVVIPVSALRKGPEGDHVWVVEADAAGALRAHERKVGERAVLGETVIVLSGVEAGQRLAASGSFKLREGVRVQAAEARRAPAAK